MKPSVEQIQNLLALKRHEAPQEGYLEDFLVEFHRRRRQEAVRSNPLVEGYRSFTTWFSGLGSSRWAYGLGVAYATALVALLSIPKNDPDAVRQNPVPVKNEIILDKDKPVEQLNDLDLRPSSQGHSGEQEF